MVVLYAGGGAVVVFGKLGPEPLKISDHERLVKCQVVFRKVHFSRINVALNNNKNGIINMTGNGEENFAQTIGDLPTLDDGKFGVVDEPLLVLYSGYYYRGRQLCARFSVRPNGAVNGKIFVLGF